MYIRNKKWLNYLILINNIKKIKFISKLLITLNNLNGDYILKDNFSSNEFVLFF